MSDKGRKMYNGITNIDDDIIMAALEAKPKKVTPINEEKTNKAKKKHSKMYYFYTWGGAAVAVLCLAVIGIAVLPTMFSSKNESTSMAPNSATSSWDEAGSASDSFSSKGDDSDGWYSEEASSAEPSESQSTNDVNSQTTVEDSSTIEEVVINPEDLEENQIYVNINFADVKEIIVVYPGYENVVMGYDDAYETVTLINKMGILTVKDDYVDGTQSDYATIIVVTTDGSLTEIMPKYPYVFVDGVVYKGNSKDKGIQNLAKYINEFVSTYVEQ